MKKSTQAHTLATQESNPKRHKWRICGDSQYLVNGCIRHYQPSAKYPDGHDCNIQSECRSNQSQKDHKDELRFNEIMAMTQKYFKDLTDSNLVSGMSKFLKDSPHGDDFDHEIIGWVQYWSDILNPQDRLDENLVKALIASESRFKEKLIYNDVVGNKHKKINPRGLMQISTDTRKFLAMTKELPEHLIVLKQEELLVGSANICAGVRWLFRKRQLITQLKRPVQWVDAVARYKSEPLCENVADYALYDETKQKKKTPMRLFWEQYNNLTGRDPW